jgi:RES domain
MDDYEAVETNAPWQLRQIIDAIKHESRFVLKEPQRAFVDAVVKLICQHFLSRVHADTIFYRARINKIDYAERDHEKIPFPASEMGPPPQYISTPGRINPEGIPYLYCAGELDTAGAELRPWKGAYLTIAEVQIRQNIILADLTLDVDLTLFWKLFFYDFAELFSIQWPPELKLNYLVTQFFAEHIKSAGFRGIRYKSEFNTGGNNYALFFEDDYEIIRTYTVETCDISYCFFERKNA